MNACIECCCEIADDFHWCEVCYHKMGGREQPMHGADHWTGSLAQGPDIDEDDFPHSEGEEWASCDPRDHDLALRSPVVPRWALGYSNAAAGFAPTKGFSYIRDTDL